MTKKELLNKFIDGDVKEGVCPYCGCDMVYMEEYDIHNKFKMLTVGYSCRGCNGKFKNTYKMSFFEAEVYDDEGEAVALW